MSSFTSFRSNRLQPGGGDRTGRISTSSVPATRISAQNGQTLTSTGIPSLDDILGGGMPLGSLLLIKEDRFTGYAMLALKYYLAQGLASQHDVLFASACTTNNTNNDVHLGNSVDSGSSSVQGIDPIFEDLMAVVKPSSSTTTSSVSADHEQDNDASGDFVPLISGLVRPHQASRTFGALRSGGRESSSTPPTLPSQPQVSDQLDIAWRYQSMPKYSSTPSTNYQSSSGSQYCHTFDLTKRIDPEVLACSSILSYDGTTLSADSPNMYRNLLANVKAAIADRCSSIATNPSKPPTLLRIGIRSFASPEWTVTSDSRTPPRIQDACIFLHALKATLRNTLAVCIVTVPAHLYDDFYGIRAEPLVRRLEHIADAVVEIESFSGSPRPVNALYASEYHGLIHSHRTFCINSHKEISRFSPVELHSLAFKVRRKRFSIETFTLPPEDADDVGNRNSSDAPAQGSSQFSTSRQHSSSISSGTGGSRNTKSGTSCASSTSRVANPLDF
ncbi:hypothetical protein BSLG_000789 [Batrachochytrium salamandrivorans]|nr:hypothetical protein BASA81_010869 [Batrachochytrium salamandrivorans]KAJ1345275.1 hypothetical protein BSLG_000789 [Batrachochytrium salamandrivorans]